MRAYPPNSPEAVARLVAMSMLADGQLHSREIDLLDATLLNEAVGMPRDAFVQVLLDTCRDLIDEAEQARVHLLDPARLARLAEDVTEPALRRKVCAAVLVVSKIDGRLSAGEQQLLRFLLGRWQIDLDDLADRAA